jgi:polysaccharide biosynthesis protein PslG
MAAILKIALVCGAIVALVAGPSQTARRGTTTGLRAAPGGGIVFHCTWSSYSDTVRKSLLDKMRAAGINWVRIDVGWSSLESSRGRYASWYARRLDHCVSWARARGIKVLADVLWTPSWANGGQGANVPPQNASDFGDAAGWMAGRWKGRISAWEIWNEPDQDDFWTGTVQQYVALLKAAYPRIKAADPGALVVTAGVTNQDTDFLRLAYQAGWQGFFDVLATHPYQGLANRPPEDGDCATDIYVFCHAPAVHDLMAQYGDGNKPIWFTEFGWSEHPNTGSEQNWQLGVTPQQQADYLVRAFRLARSQWPYVGVMFWYKDYTCGCSPEGTSADGIQEAGLGLLNNDLTARPAYTAYANYNSQNP